MLHSDSFIRFYLKYIKNKRIFRNLGIDANRIETTVIEHQLAHAATAYRSSYGYDQEDILIVTADGSGDGLSSYIRIGMGKEIGATSLLNRASHGEIKESISHHIMIQLGNAFYTEITKYLGLKPWDHESKVMSLAP